MIDRFEYSDVAKELQKRDIVFDNLINFGKGANAVKSGLSEFLMKNDFVAYFKANELVAYSAYNHKDGTNILVSIQNSNCKISEFTGRVAGDKISEFNLNHEGCQYLLNNKKQFAEQDIDKLTDYKHRCNEQGGKYRVQNFIVDSCFCYKKVKDLVDSQNKSFYIDPNTKTCENTKAPHSPSLYEILNNNLTLRKMDLGSYTKDQFNLVVKLCEKHNDDLIDICAKEVKTGAGTKKGSGKMK